MIIRNIKTVSIMNKVHECKIKKLLASFDLEELAISSRFKIRSSGKITAINFLTSFLLLQSVIARDNGLFVYLIFQMNLSHSKLSQSASILVLSAL